MSLLHHFIDDLLFRLALFVCLEDGLDLLCSIDGSLPAGDFVLVCFSCTDDLVTWFDESRFVDLMIAPAGR
jgi:hypothetical protein